MSVDTSLDDDGVYGLSGTRRVFLAVFLGEDGTCFSQEKYMSIAVRFLKRLHNVEFSASPSVEDGSQVGDFAGSSDGLSSLVISLLISGAVVIFSVIVV